MKAHVTFLVAIGVLGILSAFESRLSVFVLLLLVIAFASMSRFVHDKRKQIFWLLIVGTLCTTVGMVRFVFGEALQGITEARGRATSKRAVSLLREILFAQDAMRRYAMIDPDGDGVGSAARLGELAGTEGARQRKPLTTPPLAPRFTPRVGTGSGPANQQDGYLLLICLPGEAEGTWVTHPAEAVNEELAERRWIAYAWPAASGLGHEAAYFINEHEEILESLNLKDSKLRLVGPEQPPTCGDALDEATKTQWSPWRDKTRRKALPGEKG